MSGLIFIQLLKFLNCVSYVSHSNIQSKYEDLIMDEKMRSVLNIISMKKNEIKI